MTTEPTDQPSETIPADDAPDATPAPPVEAQREVPAVIEGDWTQAETPGSSVALENVREPEAEQTTQIAPPADEEPAPESLPTPQSAPGDEAPTTLNRPLYRDPDTAEQEAIRAADAEAAARSAESQRLAEERAARNRALGVVSATGPAVVPPPPPQKLVTDKFFGSFGLFLLRIIVAGILAVRGYQMLTEITPLKEFLATTQLPWPDTLAWVAAIAALVLAVAFLVGGFVRVAGFGLLAKMVLALVFVRWGAFNPFVAGQAGFYGELELLLAGVGLLFLTLGGGRWGLDGAYRSSRAKARAANAD